MSATGEDPIFIPSEEDDSDDVLYIKEELPQLITIDENDDDDCNNELTFDEDDQEIIFVSHTACMDDVHRHQQPGSWSSTLDAQQAQLCGISTVDGNSVHYTAMNVKNETCFASIWSLPSDDSMVNGTNVSNSGVNRLCQEGRHVSVLGRSLAPLVSSLYIPPPTPMPVDIVRQRGSVDSVLASCSDSPMGIDVCKGQDVHVGELVDSVSYLQLPHFFIQTCDSVPSSLLSSSSRFPDALPYAGGVTMSVNSSMSRTNVLIPSPGVFSASNVVSQSGDSGDSACSRSVSGSLSDFVQAASHDSSGNENCYVFSDTFTTSDPSKHISGDYCATNADPLMGYPDTSTYCVPVHCPLNVTISPLANSMPSFFTVNSGISQSRTITSTGTFRLPSLSSSVTDLSDDVSVIFSADVKCQSSRSVAWHTSADQLICAMHESNKVPVQKASSLMPTSHDSPAHLANHQVSLPLAPYCVPEGNFLEKLAEHCDSLFNTNRVKNSASGTLQSAGDVNDATDCAACRAATIMSDSRSGWSASMLSVGREAATHTPSRAISTAVSFRVDQPPMVHMSASVIDSGDLSPVCCVQCSGCQTFYTHPKAWHHYAASIPLFTACSDDVGLHTRDDLHPGSLCTATGTCSSPVTSAHGVGTSSGSAAGNADAVASGTVDRTSHGVMSSNCSTDASCDDDMSGERCVQCGISHGALNADNTVIHLTACLHRHPACAMCLMSMARRVLIGREDDSCLKCLIPDCSGLYSLGKLSILLPKLIVEILAERKDLELRNFIDDFKGSPASVGCSSEKRVKIDTGADRSLARPLNIDEKSFAAPDGDWTEKDVELLKHEGQDLPPHWAKMDDKKNLVEMVVVPLDGDSDEYINVLVRFHEGMTFPNAEVSRVIRVQNPYLWKSYSLKKEQMIQEFGLNRLNEYQLFHGTKISTVDAICRRGFDWRFCGKHGTAYGQGCYFAGDSVYSNSYTDRYPATPGSSAVLKSVLRVSHSTSSASKPPVPQPPPSSSRLGRGPNAAHLQAVARHRSLSLPHRIKLAVDTARLLGNQRPPDRLGQFPYAVGCRAFSSSVPTLGAPTSSLWHRPCLPTDCGTAANPVQPPHTVRPADHQMHLQQMGSRSKGHAQQHIGYNLHRVVFSRPTSDRLQGSAVNPFALNTVSSAHGGGVFPAMVGSFPAAVQPSVIPLLSGTVVGSVDAGGFNTVGHANIVGSYVAVTGASNVLRSNLLLVTSHSIASGAFSSQPIAQPQLLYQPFPLMSSPWRPSFYHWAPPSSAYSLSTSFLGPACVVGCGPAVGIVAHPPGISGLCARQQSLPVQIPVRHGPRYMFLARVLTGLAALGSCDYRRAPPLDPKDPFGKTYSSCVDKRDDPRVWVIFDSMQSYPEYMIEYYINSDVYY